VTYVITYRVQRAINRFESHDELYWNVTGTEWDWPIHHARVRVHLPKEVASEELLHKTFTGYFGSQMTKAAERVDPKVYEAEAEGLLPGEGLTFVLGLPKGVLEPASAFWELWWKALDNVAFFLVGLCLLASPRCFPLPSLRPGPAACRSWFSTSLRTISHRPRWEAFSTSG
jgi:hypothetical protein